MSSARRTALAAVAASVAALALVAGPAGAQTGDALDERSSTATFEVTPPPAPGIAIAPVDPAAVPDLGDVAADTAGPTDLTGDLPAMVITAPPGTASTWSVSIQMTAPFRSADAEVPASNAVAYLAGDPLVTLDMLASAYATTAEAGVDLAAGGVLVAGESGPAGGTVTYAPRVTVTIPGGTPPGTYTGTIVQTISAGS